MKESTSSSETNPMFKIIHYTTLLLCLLCCTQVQSYVFKHDDWVVWKETLEPVVKGYKNWVVQLKILDPCTRLLDIGETKDSPAYQECYHLHKTLIIKELEDISSINIPGEHLYPNMSKPIKTNWEKAHHTVEWVRGLIDGRKPNPNSKVPCTPDGIWNEYRDKMLRKAYSLGPDEEIGNYDISASILKAWDDARTSTPPPRYGPIEKPQGRWIPKVEPRTKNEATKPLARKKRVAPVIIGLLRLVVAATTIDAIDTDVYVLPEIKQNIAHNIKVGEEMQKAVKALTDKANRDDISLADIITETRNMVNIVERLTTKLENAVTDKHKAATILAVIASGLASTNDDLKIIKDVWPDKFHKRFWQIFKKQNLVHEIGVDPKPKAAKMMDENTFVTIVEAYEQAEDIKILTPIHFNIYNETADGKHLCMMKYIGPKYILYNATAKCTKGLDELDQPGIRKMHNCDTRSTLSPTDLFDSTKTKCIDKTMSPPRPEIILSESHIHVLCYGHNITIQGVSHKCPSMPFRLERNTTFELDGRKYTERNADATITFTPSITDEINNLINIKPVRTKEFEEFKQTDERLKEIASRIKNWKSIEDLELKFEPLKNITGLAEGIWNKTRQTIKTFEYVLEITIAAAIIFIILGIWQMSRPLLKILALPIRIIRRTINTILHTEIRDIEYERLPIHRINRPTNKGIRYM